MKTKENTIEIEKVSIEDDAEFILKEAGIKTTDENIENAVQIMEEALMSAIDDGDFEEDIED